MRPMRTALPLLFEILKKGSEPLAVQEDVQAAVVAANAMGAIGGEEAKSLLTKAKRRTNMHTKRAIDSALANPGERCNPK